MEKIITISAIFILAIGTMGSDTCCCADLPCDVLTRKEKQEVEARSSVIESAKRWLDVYEITGKNDHPMIQKSMEICGLCGTCGYPWCASCQSEIFSHAGVSTLISARVVDWFKSNIVWERSWNTPIPKKYMQPAQNIGFYYKKLNRYGHISMIVWASDKRVYCMEGNTSSKGTYDPTTFEMVEQGEDTERDGDAFYPKTHSYYEIDVISDKILQGKDFSKRYDDYLKAAIP